MERRGEGQEVWLELDLVRGTPPHTKAVLEATSKPAFLEHALDQSNRNVDALTPAPVHRYLMQRWTSILHQTISTTGRVRGRLGVIDVWIKVQVSRKPCFHTGWAVPLDNGNTTDEAQWIWLALTTQQLGINSHLRLYSCPLLSTLWHTWHWQFSIAICLNVKLF